MLGQIRDDLDVSVEEFEQLLRQEGEWVRYQTTQSISLITFPVVIISTVILTIVFWRFGDLPFLLALIRAIIVAMFAVGTVGAGVAFYLAGRYEKQRKSRLERFKARKATAHQPSLTEAVQGLVDAASKTVGNNPEQLEALLRTWADAGMKELEPYADELKKGGIVKR